MSIRKFPVIPEDWLSIKEVITALHSFALAETGSACNYLVIETISWGPNFPLLQLKLIMTPARAKGTPGRPKKRTEHHFRETFYIRMARD